MNYYLKWAWLPDGIEYILEGPSGTVSVEQWGLVHRELKPLHRRAVTLLLRHQDDPACGGLITCTDTPGLLLDHSLIAQEDFPSTELLLPPPAPVTIAIESTSAVTSSNCRISWRLVEGNGRIVVAPKIRGCLIDIGRHTYLLKDPLYSLIRGIEEFNAIDGKNTEARMLKWGELVRILPGDAQVSPYLKTMRITRAGAFRLELRTDSQHQISFDPVLVAPRTRPLQSGEGPEALLGESTLATQPPQQLLPPNDQDNFSTVFRRSREVRSRYLIDVNTHVVLEPALVKVLRVVRAMQMAPVEERLAFLKSPHAYFRKALEEDPDVGAAAGEDEEWVQRVLDEVFDATGYGDRVRAIGLWQPKVLPWLASTTTQWLPDESDVDTGSQGQAQRSPQSRPSCGIMIEGQPVPIALPDIPRLIGEIRAARAQGQLTIDYDGVAIPTTLETENALTTLLQLKDTPQTEPGAGVGAVPEGDGAVPTHQPPTPFVLLIHDNLEGVTYGVRGKPRATVEVDVQFELASPLKPHQLEGLHWLQKHWKQGSRGALLADDMGLGKTLQALAFLRWVQRQLEDSDSGAKSNLSPHLVVAPTGLLANWIAEHDRHLRSPGLGAPVFAYGRGLKTLRRPDGLATRYRTGQPRPVGSLDIKRLETARWVLTTYETLRDYHMDFGQIRWAVIVFDEAQRIKDPQSLMTNAAKSMQAEFFLCLTGTPVENRLADFWCIVDTAQPGLLKDLQTFVKTYETPVEPDKLTGCLQELRRTVDEGEPMPPTHPKVMLRRIKHDHLEGLPPRTVFTCPEPMPPLQAERYALAVEEGRRGGREGGNMLAVLQQLRRISLHPRTEDIDVLSPEQIIEESARFKAMFRVLTDIHSKGEKVLIFVDDLLWIQHLRIMVQDHFQLARLPLAITGEVAGEKRKALVDEFQEAAGFQVLFMTPRAGGVGLTVTAANHVIHLSRWWNPAVEDQATDRVYRIGQTRPVFIYYPMAIHPQWPGSSFDERLHEHLERKRSLSRQLLLPGEFSEGEVVQLFDETVGPVGSHPSG